MYVLVCTTRVCRGSDGSMQAKLHISRISSEQISDPSRHLHVLNKSVIVINILYLPSGVAL
jgi:hypothetical protein